jgi:N-acetylmuramoyl-L-alanine amidase
MNTSRWLPAVLLTTASFFSFGALSPATASTFASAEVTTDNFIAVAAPFGENKHQLLIIEQLSNRQPCWSESGSNPVSVEPLLLNFDFTGICGRSTDSNGYSIRMNGEDLGLDYILRLVERNGELVLVGSNRRNRNAPEIEIGRTRGMSDGFEKIFLDSGWRFTRRTYQGKALGHIYLTNDGTAPANPEVSTGPQSQPEAPVRELIFTTPGTEPSTPGGSPATNPQTLPPLPAPASRVPELVVPTPPQPEPPVPVEEIPESRPQTRPESRPQTQPSPPPSNREIPVFVVPTK